MDGPLVAPSPPAARRRHRHPVELKPWHEGELQARMRRGRSPSEVFEQLLEESADGKKPALAVRVRGHLNTIHLANQNLQKRSRDPELVQWFTAIAVAVAAIGTEFPA